MFRWRLSTNFYAWSLALCVIVCGCRDKRVFRLKGDFNHLKQAEFYIYSTDGGINRVDTIPVVKGQFDWQTSLERSATFYIIFPNLSEQVVFAMPGDVIRMKGDAEQLRLTRVEGSEDNEQLTDFRIDHADDSPAQLTEAMKDYIRMNPDSRVSTHLQRQLMVKKSSLSLLHKGQKIKNVVLPPDGLSDEKDTLVLKAGQPTLFVFWANWKRDSPDAFPTIRKCLQKSASADLRHQLKAVSISLDTDVEKYSFTCRYDSVDWTTRCYRQSWDSPLVKQWGIHEVPYYVLTDTLMTVVALGHNWEKDIEPHIDKLIKKD